MEHPWLRRRTPAGTRYTGAMQPEPTKRRRPRLFERAKAEDRELTPRELALLWHIARHRLLASADLALLDGGSKQNLLRILRDLFDMGLIDRPRMQVNHWTLAGAPRPMLYGIAAKGARLLHGRRGDAGDAGRNKRAGAVFMQHTSEIAGFFVGLEVGCRGRTDVSLLAQGDVLAEAPEPTRKLREPLRIKGRGEGAPGRPAPSVIPDGMFALAYGDGTAAHFFLELDRGTMPVVRKGLDRTSFARKIGVYLDAWKTGVLERQFGVRHWRILTVTPSKERIATMVAAVKSLTKGNGSGLFLFVDRESLAAGTPLDVEWVDGRGLATRLADG